jgi:putative membrane protein insertion efficiency factor
MTSVRSLLWQAGAPARLILRGAISLYRLTLSGWLGGQCRFSPSCSRYAEEAIRTHGAFKGSLLMVGRVLRCNPFGRGGLDPVPRAHPHNPARRLGADLPNLPYDSAIQSGAIRKVTAGGGGPDAG